MSLPRGHDTTAGRPPSTGARAGHLGGDEHRLSLLGRLPGDAIVVVRRGDELLAQSQISAFGGRPEDDVRATIRTLSRFSAGLDGLDPQSGSTERG